MKLEHNGHSFEFFDDISQLPISQFHLYSKYCLVMNGIGDSLSSVNHHIEKLVSYLKTGNTDSAVAELVNYQKNLYSVANCVDYRNKAFLCLIKSVDGQRWTDYSDEGINALYGLVLSVSEREMLELSGALQKKLDEALVQYFPDLFATATEKNYNELVRQRALLQLEEIIDRKDNKDRIWALTSQILGWYSPKKFEGKENAEVEFDKQFERMCLAISKEFGGIPKQYTVMEFYTANAALKEQAEALQKIRKK